MTPDPALTENKAPAAAVTLKTIILKARPVFAFVFAVYILSYSAGYLAGKLNWADTKALQNSRLFQLSRNLEYKVPGYSALLKGYKKWHDNCQMAYLFEKNAWGLGTLFFINNSFVANLTMIIRAAFVLPMTLTIFGKFFQGVVFAQTAGSSRLLSLFILEFGGYFLTVSATLTLVFWTLLPGLFRFARRKEAFLAGLRLLGFACLLSGVGILIASILETRFILKFMI